MNALINSLSFDLHVVVKRLL